MKGLVLLCARRFLTRLLLVHGSLSAYRLSRLIKYSFYKNVAFGFLLFYYQARHPPLPAVACSLPQAPSHAHQDLRQSHCTSTGEFSVDTSVCCMCVQFYNGFSGQAMVDDISAAAFNVIFTSVPILLFAVLDRPVQRIETLLRFPQVGPQPSARSAVHDPER